MSWATQRERGGRRATLVAVAAVRRFGWGAGRPLARGAAWWFLLTSPGARAASRDYLGRVLGRAARGREVARHFEAFAMSVLDRVMLACGHADEFEVKVDGLAALVETLGRGGAILLGGHVGSFEILRTLAARAPVPVWALMYRENGGALTALLDGAAPGLRERVIEIGDTASMLRARECIERGEIVGILADRGPQAHRADQGSGGHRADQGSAGHRADQRSAGHRSVAVPFLGGVAGFPAGPFLLAATLGAPVFFCYGIRTGPRRYRIGIEPFAERLALRRECRQADLLGHVGRFAGALERLCRANPFQWFNFFPFWTEPHDPVPPRRASPPDPGRRG